MHVYRCFSLFTFIYHMYAIQYLYVNISANYFSIASKVFIARIARPFSLVFLWLYKLINLVYSKCLILCNGVSSIMLV